MESLVGTTNVVFCSGYNAYTLIRNLRVGSLAQIIPYDPRSGFPYYSLTTPDREDTPCPSSENALWV
jgi:hypothetical protein